MQVSEHVGKYFRVEEELSGLLGKHFGRVGTVTKFDEENQEATLVSSTETELTSGAFKVPFTALASFDRKSNKRRGLKDMKCDELTKEALLIQMGFPDVDSMPDFEPVTSQAPQYFENDQIVMWSALLQWTFEDLSVFVYHPQYVLVLLDKFSLGDGKGEGETDEDNKANLHRVAQKFKENLSNFELHLFPVHSGIVLDGESSHWTLLALDYETKSARWYETLDDPKEFCLSSMTYICELSAIKMPDKRENLLRQTGVECGLGVMHYLEKEMRMAAGEGKGSVLGFVPARWREMRQTLGKMTKMVNAFKKHLIERQKKEKAQQIALETLKMQSVQALEIRMAELQKIKDAQSAIGENFFSGVDLDVVLPADFQPKKTRLKTKTAASGDFKKAAKAFKDAEEKRRRLSQSLKILRMRSQSLRKHQLE